MERVELRRKGRRAVALKRSVALKSCLGLSVSDALNQAVPSQRARVMLDFCESEGDDELEKM